MRTIHLHWRVEDQSQTQTLKAEGEITIGRKPDCTVSIPHQTVSRQHATLYAQGDDLILRNLSKTNPITINQGRILQADQETVIQDGDTFVLGTVAVHVQLSIADDKPRLKLKVKCTGCGKVVESDLTDCPWCGTSLAFGETFIGSV